MDWATTKYLSDLNHYVSKFIPKNIPANLQDELREFYMRETHKNLTSVHQQYGMFILDYYKANSWTPEINEKYGSQFDENSYCQALQDIVEVFQAPEEWTTYFDQLNMENIVLLYKTYVDELNNLHNYE